MGTLTPRSPRRMRKLRRSSKLPRRSREFRLWSETSYLKPKTTCPVHPETARFLCTFWLKILWGCLTVIHPPSSLRSQSSNKTSCKPFGDHLLGQTAQNPRLRIPGLNTAQVRIQAFLGHDLWGIRSEIFWYETSPKYLLSHMPKTDAEDLKELLLTGQSVKIIPLTRLVPPGGTWLSFLSSSLPTCVISSNQLN